MDIKLKFKLGVTAWTLRPDYTPVSFGIESVTIHKNEKAADGFGIYYFGNDNDGNRMTVNEENCFASREALIQKIAGGQ